MLNQFQLIGNLTRDVEHINGGTDKSRSLFDIAVNMPWKNKEGEKQEKAYFFRIKTFKGLADTVAKHLSKGSKVFVQGYIEPTEYEKDGKKVYSTDFVAQTVEFLSAKKDKEEEKSE